MCSTSLIEVPFARLAFLCARDCSSAQDFHIRHRPITEKLPISETSKMTTSDRAMAVDVSSKVGGHDCNNVTSLKRRQNSARQTDGKKGHIKTSSNPVRDFSVLCLNYSAL